MSTLSEYINDEINNDRIGTLLTFSDNKDAADRMLIEGSKYDLNKYEKQNHEKVGASIKELVKKWEGVESNMTLSGKHDNDPFHYCGKGGFPLYYFVLMIELNNAEDSLKPKLTSYLRDNVFFDSGIKRQSTGNTASKKRRKKVTKQSAILMNILLYFRQHQIRRCNYFLTIRKKKLFPILYATKFQSYQTLRQNMIFTSTLLMTQHKQKKNVTEHNEKS